VEQNELVNFIITALKKLKKKSHEKSYNFKTHVSTLRVNYNNFIKIIYSKKKLKHDVEINDYHK